MQDGSSHVGKDSRHLHDPELRQKILLTLLLLAIYRIGWQIPLPIVDQRR